MSGVRDEPRNDETDRVADLQNGQSLARIFAPREADLHPPASLVADKVNAHQSSLVLRQIDFRY
jgi:hypothetical protein